MEETQFLELKSYLLTILKNQSTICARLDSIETDLMSDELHYYYNNTIEGQEKKQENEDGENKVAQLYFNGYLINAKQFAVELLQQKLEKQSL